MKKILLLFFALPLTISVLLISPSCAGKNTQEKQKAINDSIPAVDNINNIGDWEISYYVDDFGEATNEGFVYMTVYGTFSNSATTNSNLKAKIIVDTSSIRINLYEYAGNHPIKDEGFLNFKARDSGGNDYKFTTYNSKSGDNTVMNMNYKIDDKVVRDLLLSGGEIKFIGISDKYGSTSEYKFTIKNANFLEKALSKIK